MTSLYHKLTSIPSLMQDMQDFAVLAEESICGCATCKEAMEAAIRLGDHLYQNQCPYYILQVGVALINYAKTMGVAMDIRGNETMQMRDLNSDEIESIIRDNISDFEERTLRMGAALARDTEHMFNAVEAAWTKKNGN